MKRITAMILAVVMLLTMTVVASAQDTVTITVGSVKGEVGDIVQVPVSVSDGHYLVNGRIFLQYDSSVMELQKVCADEDNPYFETVNPAVFDSACMWGFAVPTAGRANFVFATSKDSGSAVGGVMYTLTFKLLRTTDGGAVTVTVPEMRRNNGGEDFDAMLTLVSGDVTVKPFDPTPAVKGDTDGNGTVDLSDAVRLFCYVNGMVQMTDKQLVNADVNGDGNLTLADASRLFYHISGEFEL